MQRQNSNKKVFVGIFAHPDDEAFGPGGTLHKYSKTHDIYILCATHGEAGEGNGNIGKIRQEELLKSANLIGIKKVYFLGFIDGCLCNADYHKLAAKVESYLKKLKPEIVMTFEQRGVSGHLDHIAVSMVTSFVVDKLNFVKELQYFCLSEEKRDKFGSYFIYFPPGYKKSEIDKTVNIKDVWDLKVKAMKMHKSQMTDVKRVINALEKGPKEEHFLIKKFK